MKEKDLGHLRKSYTKNELTAEDITNDPLQFFRTWFDEADHHPEIEEANAMMLATLGLDDFPKARVVLLKALTEQGFHSSSRQSRTQLFLACLGTSSHCQGCG